jgi:hypothetical protein
MLDNCNTEYFLFLEHDWEFIYDIDVTSVINCMDKYNHISYIKFNRLLPKETDWNLEEGGCFENETEITDIPLIKISYFSGNPHIMRTDIMKNKYLSWYSERWNDEMNINPYIEKDLMQIARNHINQFGKYEQQLMWGCYAYGSTDNLPVVIKHLGDWCRKK